MPEASMNPFGYKFSWSPKGVLSASTQPAKYIQEGATYEVDGNSLFTRRQDVSIFPGFSLEGIPNRDCTIYIDQYGLGPEIRTFFRGTLRYRGWGEVLQGMVRIGLLGSKPVDYLDPKAPPITCNAALRNLLKAKPHVSTSRTVKHFLRPEMGFPDKGFDDDQTRHIVNAMKWLGMMSEEVLDKRGSWIDTMAELMSKRMPFEKAEYDMIILHHIFGIELPNGTLQTKTSTLVVHGNQRMSAMAKTVGMPAAIAAELIVEGHIKQTGVVGPLHPSIYVPVLKALKSEGVGFVERLQRSQKI